MTVQICSRVNQISAHTNISPKTSAENVPITNTSSLCQQVSVAVLSLYEVLGKHYDKASVCTLKSKRYSASPPLSFRRSCSWVLNMFARSGHTWRMWSANMTYRTHVELQSAPTTPNPKSIHNPDRRYGDTTGLLSHLVAISGRMEKNAAEERNLWVKGKKDKYFLQCKAERRPG